MSLVSQLNLAFTRIAQEIKARDLGKSIRTSLSANQSVANGSNPISVGLESNDDSTYFTITSGKVVVLKAGLYMVEFYSTVTPASSTYASIRLMLNGTTVRESGRNVDTTGARFEGTHLRRLAANDTLNIDHYIGNNGTVFSGAPNTGLNVARLGA